MGVARRKQERRLEMFEDTYTMWTERRLTQAVAAARTGEFSIGAFGEYYFGTDSRHIADGAASGRRGRYGR